MSKFCALTVRGALVALAALLLASCASQPEQSPEPDWQAHLLALQTLDHWEISGKVALRSPHNSDSATLRWRQEANQAAIHLSGPIGVGATAISSDGKTLTVQHNNETQVLDISSREAIRLNTGWDLPLKSLPHWLKGAPDPRSKTDKMRLDSSGNYLALLQQDGWEVLYQDYGVFQGVRLPTRLQVTNGDTRAKVIIRHWRNLDD